MPNVKKAIVIMVTGATIDANVFSINIADWQTVSTSWSLLPLRK